MPLLAGLAICKNGGSEEGAFFAEKWTIAVRAAGASRKAGATCTPLVPLIWQRVCSPDDHQHHRARAYAATGDRAASRKAYEDFFALWKDADPDVPILVAATPSVEMELGGQAFERWPRELFVSPERAAQALSHFLDYGTHDPALEWIK